LKNTVVDAVAVTEKYLLSHQFVEYTSKSRRQALKELAESINSLTAKSSRGHNKALPTAQE